MNTAFWSPPVSSGSYVGDERLICQLVSLRRATFAWVCILRWVHLFRGLPLSLSDPEQ